MDIQSNLVRGRFLTHELGQRRIRHYIVFAACLGSHLFYSHAFVLKQVRRNWILLDSALPGPLYSVAKDRKKKWHRRSFFLGIHHMNVFTLEEDVLQRSDYQRIYIYVLEEKTCRSTRRTSLKRLERVHNRRGN